MIRQSENMSELYHDQRVDKASKNLKGEPIPEDDVRFKLLKRARKNFE